MRYYLSIQLLFLTILFSYGQGNKSVITGLSKMDSDDTYLITRTLHESWIAWSNDDKSIFYTDSETGRNNLYSIRLDKVEFTELQENFFVANYLMDPTLPKPYTKITFERDRDVDSPMFLPGTNSVAYRTHFRYSPNDFFDYDIRIFDLDKRKTKIVYKGEAVLYDFIDSKTMLFVHIDNLKSIQRLDIETGKISPYLELEFDIRALQYENDKLLIKSQNSVYTYDLIKQNLSKIFTRRLFSSRLVLINEQLISTFSGPSTGMIDIYTKNYTPFFNAQDHEPAPSNNQKFIAAISDQFMGILIKKFEIPKSSTNP